MDTIILMLALACFIYQGYYYVRLNATYPLSLFVLQHYGAYIIIALMFTFLTGLSAAHITVWFTGFIFLDLLAHVYRKYFKKSNVRLRHLIYGGMVGVVTLATLLAIENTPYMGTGHLMSLIITYGTIAIPTLLILWLNQKGSIDFNRLFKHNTASSFKKNSTLTKHYHDAGLSDEDIHYFRQEMSVLRDLIIQLEDEMNQAAKLKAVNVRHNTIDVAQKFFQAIVKDPTRIVNASNTIYRTIPSLADLAAKYNEINHHIAKTKQTYLLLERTVQTIEELSEQLTEEYLAFHQEVINDLDDEIKFAEKNLHRSQHDFNDTSNL